jgi:hypothetical protein
MELVEAAELHVQIPTAPEHGADEEPEAPAVGEEQISGLAVAVAEPCRLLELGRTGGIAVTGQPGHVGVSAPSDGDHVTADGDPAGQHLEEFGLGGRVGIEKDEDVPAAVPSPEMSRRARPETEIRLREHPGTGAERPGIGRSA